MTSCLAVGDYKLLRFGAKNALRWDYKYQCDDMIWVLGYIVT